MNQTPMQGKRVIIHAGFPRTGSTLLQQEIFPRFDGSVKVITPLSKDRRLIDLFTLSCRNVKLVPIGDTDKKYVDDIVSEYPENTLLISFEGLLGDQCDNFLSLPHITEELRAYFPEAEILVIVRRQSEMVKSFYRLLVWQDGYHKSLKEFVRFEDGKFEGYRDQWTYGVNVYPPGIDFFSLVAFLESSFGAGKVHVLPYEWIKSDFGRFCNSLATIVGTSLPNTAGPPPVINRGPHGYDLMLMIGLNRFWDARLFGFPIVPKRPFASHFDLDCPDYREKYGWASWFLRAVISRMSPAGVLPMVSPVLSPLIKGLGVSEDPDRTIEMAIDEAVFPSNAALNEKLGGILSGLGYCDCR